MKSDQAVKVKFARISFLRLGFGQPYDLIDFTVVQGQQFAKA
ncbi:hypothetical protein [Mucilaginibacter sp. 10I4]|nr:hypothetical protein [Mucilaginibacter sp. 10I4]MEB0277246.1 hypothetical protein [Mucilaginibacter sp. 10B2]